MSTFALGAVAGSGVEAALPFACLWMVWPPALSSALEGRELLAFALMVLLALLVADQP